MSHSKFQDKYDELQRLVRLIESDALSIDELAENVSRAYTLIKECRDVLTQINEQVGEIIANAEKAN